MYRVTVAEIIPAKEKGYESMKEIYVQLVDQIDLLAVINAVNSASWKQPDNMPGVQP